MERMDAAPVDDVIARDSAGSKSQRCSSETSKAVPTVVKRPSTSNYSPVDS